MLIEDGVCACLTFFQEICPNPLNLPPSLQSHGHEHACHASLFTSHPSCITGSSQDKKIMQFDKMCFSKIVVTDLPVISHQTESCYVIRPWSLVSEPQAFPERQGPSRRGDSGIQTTSTLKGLDARRWKET